MKKMSNLKDNSTGDLNTRTPHTTKKYFAYAMGGPVVFTLGAMSSRIQYFAAHVLLFPMTIVALIFFIYSLVDSINDPLIGYLSDRSTKFTEKYGKRFPWILTGHILQPIFLILIYIPFASIVNDPDNMTLKLVWIIIIMCVYETMGTVSEVNRAALFPDLFRGQSERSKSIGASQITKFIIQICFAILIPLILGSLGGKDDPNAYLGTAIVCAILSYIFLIPFTYGVYENKQMKAFRVQLDIEGKNNSPIKETLVRIFKDRNYMAFIIVITLHSIAGTCFLFGLPFFLYDGLGYAIDDPRAMLPQIIILIMNFVGMLLFIPLIKKYGARKCGIFNLILFAVCLLLFFFLPVETMNYLIVFGGLFNGGVALSGIYIGAESIDNAVIKSGKREEGSYGGVLRVFTAYSYTIQTLIFAIVSSISGYVSSDPSTYSAAYTGLLMQISVIPFLLLIIGTIIFVLMYNISKEDALKNAEKLNQLGL